jgi:hypothetical protein
VRFLTQLGLLTCLLTPAILMGQNSAPLSAGAKVYIAPMEWQMEQFITAEIRRQALPVNLVASPSEADFVMTGSAEKLSSHFMAPGRCFHVTVATADGSHTVWSGEGDDYAMVFGRFRSHGPGRAARSIVDALRARYFRKTR